MEIRQPNTPPEAEADYLLAAIAEGVAAADAGDLVEHEDVVAWVRSWNTSGELPQPETLRRGRPADRE
jgi:predicted transcriptional regulator